jgi:hypothetical protein
VPGPERARDKKRAFVSYSRQDGVEVAADLTKRLTKEGFSLWRDLSEMEGGRDWWDQIVEALDNVEFLLLVLTPRALKSPVVQREWRTARQKGVYVIPVAGAPIDQLDRSGFPTWMRDAHIVDVAVKEQWDRLVVTLQEERETPRVPFMAGPLPENFVARPKETEELIASLLSGDRQRPVGVTAALRGAGGYGKTTLAKAICHDERVQEEFYDGILWVEIGKDPGDLTAKVTDLIEVLTGERPGFANANVAGSQLGQILGDRHILLVVDDVWERRHADPFLVGGIRTARLITTRMQEALPLNTAAVPVDHMEESESLQILRSGLETEPNERLLRDLAARLGRMPQSLTLVNKTLRERCEQGEAIDRAVEYVTRRFKKQFDYREAIATTLSLSLEQLDRREGARSRFYELAIFPEDARVPLSVVARLWSATSGLDEDDTEDVCQWLFKLSLLSTYDLEARTISLHDTIRNFLRWENRNSLAGWNAQLVSTVGDAPWGLSLSEQYLWGNLAFHLVEAGQRDRLEALLSDYRYLDGKLRAVGPNPLLADFSLVGKFPEIEGAIRLSAHTLSKFPDQLAAQLCGRLTLDEKLDQSIRSQLAKPYIWPRFPSFTAPGGGLIRTLEGHSGSVSAVAVTPDGQRAVSGSSDNTLKVWDLETCRELHALTGHSSYVTAVAVTPDGRHVVSASDDRSLRVWIIADGREILRLDLDAVCRAVATTRDGTQIVAGDNLGRVHFLRLERD